MTDAQALVCAAIAAFALFYYKFFLAPILSKPMYADDFDIGVSRFKQRRIEQGLCMYCGKPRTGTLLSGGEWVAPISEKICNACYDDLTRSP
jgi:hypothetical protein